LYYIASEFVFVMMMMMMMIIIIIIIIIIRNKILYFFDVLLTVHLSIILAIDQLNAQILVL